MAAEALSSPPNSEKYPLPKLENGRFQLPWDGNRPSARQVLWGFATCKESSGIPSQQVHISKVELITPVKYELR